MDKVNYPRWKRKSDNDEVNQPSTKEADIQRRESTINDQQSSMIASQRDNLLTYCWQQYTDC